MPVGQAFAGSVPVFAAGPLEIIELQKSCYQVFYELQKIRNGNGAVHVRGFYDDSNFVRKRIPST